MVSLCACRGTTLLNALLLNNLLNRFADALPRDAVVVPHEPTVDGSGNQQATSISENRSECLHLLNVVEVFLAKGLGDEVSAGTLVVAVENDIQDGFELIHRCLIEGTEQGLFRHRIARLTDVGLVEIHVWHSKVGDVI